MDPPVACDTVLFGMCMCVCVCACVWCERCFVPQEIYWLALQVTSLPGGRGTTAHLSSIQNKNRAEQEWGKF